MMQKTAESARNSLRTPEERADPVIGGMPAGACSWPSTVIVNGATSCTGTLIHPRVVTTAAHCIGGAAARITFGPGRTAQGAFTLNATCKAGASGESGVNTARDWGYCVLPEDDRLKQIPITPPLVGCEAERFLKPGAHAWIACSVPPRGPARRRVTATAAPRT